SWTVMETGLPVHTPSIVCPQLKIDVFVPRTQVAANRLHVTAPYDGGPSAGCQQYVISVRPGFAISNSAQ
ncbi:MAG: hypothetical protein OER77_07175, partial [Myxococcales bacterium]|nr:hypothetical protein [Myxococcales bacterium]